MAGRRNENDSRNDLINSYIKFVETVEPKIIFFENVKGFTMEFKKNKEKGIAYSSIVTQKLNDLGYFVKGQLVNFGEYGVPQKRTRFILVGIKKELKNASQEKVETFFSMLKENKFDFLAAKGLTTETNLQDAISDLFKTNGLKPTPDFPNFQSGLYGKEKNSYQKLMREGVEVKIPDSHRFPKHSAEISKRFKDILAVTHNRRNLDLSKEVRESFNIKKHTVIPLNGLDKSPTITTLPDDYIHYEEPRILTVREYARIQTFPDDWEFTGSIAQQYKQIGNAVPVNLGKEVGYSIVKFLNSYYNLSKPK